MTERREVAAKLRHLLTIAEDGSNAETLADYLISMSDDADREEFLQGLVEAAEGTDTAAAAVAVAGVLSAIRDMGSKGDTAKRACFDGTKDDVSGGRTNARRKNRRKGGAGTPAANEREVKAASPKAASSSSPASKPGSRAREQKEQARNQLPFTEESFPMLSHAALSSSKQKPPQSQNRTSSSPFRYVAPKPSYSTAQDQEHSYPELGFSAAHDTGPKEWVKPTKITRGRDLCLSMWQPWASLVISGHKRVEGRSWYSTHRGRLWIHAGSRNPSKEEIEALEWEYKDRGIPFPKSYPVSCLLGCIEVEDMLSQQEYAEKFGEDREENSSAFVFVCSRPNPLINPISLSGQHKICTAAAHQAPFGLLLLALTLSHATGRLDKSTLVLAEAGLTLPSP